jgi:phosphate transport system substrate-binding protein
MIIMALITGCTGTGGPPQELQGRLLVVGSTALQPLADAAAKLFMKQHPQTKVEVRGGGSISGLRAVTGRQSDIGTSDIYADPAIYPDPDLTDHIFCVIPFTVIVGPGVNVPSLTLQQIIDIFSTGKIKNWKEVGGSDLPITPVVRPPTSGTRDTFRKYVLGGRDEIGIPLISDSSTEVRNRVASTPGAIGYVALSYVKPPVRAIAINGYMPTQENIAADHYPYWSYGHMYTLGNINALQDTFLDFMLTPAVQELAQKLSYISITKTKLSSTTTPTGIGDTQTGLAKAYGGEGHYEYH